MSDQPATHHRLEGLEPDNLLAFLALLGLLRSLEAAERDGKKKKLYSRAVWDVSSHPLRPVLVLSSPLTQQEVAAKAASGLAVLAKSHDFGARNRADLNYPRNEARSILEEAVISATLLEHDRADLLASLMSDAAVKEDKNPNAAPIDPTPFCLLFGQGHQHFLERLLRVPAEPTPPPRGRGKGAKILTAEECLAETLFAKWRRSDPTFSFRWDPEEAVRYAMMAGDPTDSAYASGTQHGANRLAAVGLAALTIAPEIRAGRVRPAVLGGAFDAQGFSFSWPIWTEPATLSAIRALLSHPDLRKPGSIGHLGVDHVLTSRRISLGKFMNFTRARVLSPL